MVQFSPNPAKRTNNHHYSILRHSSEGTNSSSHETEPTNCDRQILNSTSAENLQILGGISLLILQSLNQENILETAVVEIRQALKADRVVVFRFNADWSGTIVAESVAPGWPSALMQHFNDTCFRNGNRGYYQSGFVHATNNIYEAGLTGCYIKTLEQFAVKANLVAPIVRTNQLLGLLIAHQCSGPREWEISDIELFGQVAIQVGFALEHASLLEQQQTQAWRSQLLTQITQLIRRSLKLEDILNTTVREVRQALKADRVVVFRFDADWIGTIVAESVAAGWPHTLMKQFDDPCFRDHYVAQYQSGRVHATDNIYEAGLTECYIKTLEQFAVKANLVAPIISDNQLLGLLIAHQCLEAREWQISDIDLFGQVATQVGFALDKAALLENREAEAKRVQVLKEIALLMRQSLKVKDIFNTTVSEVRQALKADRVLVYRFNADWSGVVTAESVARGLPSALWEQLEDSCFRESYAQLYRSGRVRAISDIYKAKLTACHIRSLERFAVKSNLVAPILKDGNLFGLLIAHQCLRFRVWQQPEIDLFAQISTQAGFALEQAQMVEKMEQITQIANQVGFALNYAQEQELDTHPPQSAAFQKAVEMFDEDKEHDATVTFAELPWLQQ